jgi:hypothetical protein
VILAGNPLENSCCWYNKEVSRLSKYLCLNLDIGQQRSVGGDTDPSINQGEIHFPNQVVSTLDILKVGE